MVLVIIPARGGSKGIPRKNLRPLAGMPLIYYAINAALNAKTVDEVVVTTDDDEISLFAERFGAKVLRRPQELANDASTLDPVIVHAVKSTEDLQNKMYDIVVTIQPTSPLLKASDIDAALTNFSDPAVDTVISVVDDRHLCWGVNKGRPTPRYSNRVNRQQLPENYKETGAIIACSRSQIMTGTRIGKNVALHVMPHERSFDIDSIADLYLCEAMLTQKRIVFTVIGRPAVGMGHAFRVAMFAHELVQHEIIIVCKEDDKLAYNFIKNLNYQCHLVDRNVLLTSILELQPDLVINDILDTDFEYVSALKAEGISVINFEDLGPGSEEADLVINALYPHQVPSDRHLVGARYFSLRDEFLHLPNRSHCDNVRRVLITFGGTDENNLSAKTLSAILPKCETNDIIIDIVVGPGFLHHNEVYDIIQTSRYKGINYIAATTRISENMVIADLAFTSGGRTVFELSAVGVPTIVLCQNERETMHTFASSENGLINLGLCHSVSSQMIAETFSKVVHNTFLRETMHHKMKTVDLTGGKARVIGEISRILARAKK